MKVAEVGYTVAEVILETMMKVTGSLWDKLFWRL